MLYSCDRSFFSVAGLSGNSWIFLLFFVQGLLSCHSPSGDRISHSSYFDQAFSKADSIDPDHKEKAFAFLDSVYNVFPDPGPEDLFRKYDYKRHYFYETRKDYLRAMVYVDSQLFVIRDKSSQKGFIEDYGRALFSKGDILLEERKYSDAFLYYYQGRQIIEKTGDTCVFGEYSGRLGMVCYKQARYREAMALFKGTFNDLSHCTDKDGFAKFVYQQGQLDNIALCYGNLGVTDSALYYYDSALSYIRQNEGAFPDNGSHSRFIQTAKGVVYGNQADALYKKGEPAAAEALYRESIRINRQKEHANEDAQFTMVKLARLYLSGGKIARVGEVLDELRKSLDSLPGGEAELQWRQLQWHYSDRLRRTGAAYGYLQAYLRLKDSLEAGNKPADVNEELQHIAHEYDLALLKKQDELKTGYLTLAVLFLAMAVIIIYLVWQNWRRSRKNVTVLTSLNQRIQTQNDHMQKALSALEQSQRDNTRMMKIVAHDLRNPIGASGSIAALLLKKPDLPKDQKPLLELIHTSSQNSLELITDLLHVNTIPEEMKKEPVDMQATLQYCVELLQFKAASKRQRLLLKTVEASILGNREKIWRVISNLITNAIKFSPEGTDIEVELLLYGEGIRISVKDQGIGIPAAMKDKIFSPFTEAKRRGTAGEESFGLGLSISKQIIEAHGGKIWHENGEERGTVFYVELPGRATRSKI
ncbi:MAG TPA: tetratricopeptide repeat-containing sensor histidine kinase [Puia sp.]